MSGQHKVVFKIHHCVTEVSDCERGWFLPRPCVKCHHRLGATTSRRELPLNLSGKSAPKPNGREDVGLKKPVSISGMDGSVSRDIQVAQNKKPKPEYQTLAFWRLVLVPTRVQ